MTLPEGITFGSFVLGTLGFMWHITQDEAGKRSRIYERIDEIKKDLEEKTQSKEICSIHLAELKADLQEIKTDLKLLLQNSKKNNA